GSRQGKVAKGQAPVFVQADSAERGYVPGPVEPGTWSVELGFGAVQTEGAEWMVTVTCLDVATGPVWVPDPVDPSYVARDKPGWYRGDFHLHAYHSNSKGPDPQAMVEFARAAKLDIVPVTEYVTDTHWGTLGPAQRANPDLLIWPGREVITYYGHAIVLGETPSTIDYRQGFGTITLGDIERSAVADGAVFQIAHPTIFPGEALQAFCRGCEFRLADTIDLDLVDTIEVVTSAVVVDPSTQGRPAAGVTGIANPFVPTAIDYWESLLQEGHRITAVSGSDDKLGPDYGETATMVHADRLSRPALVDALRAGHAYVQAKGADASPTMDIDARSPDGARASFGDTLVAKTATIDVTVQGANGQSLVVSRDGSEVQRIPVTSDAFTATIAADRDAGEGPLGTFWRVDVADELSVTAIGNPVFLADKQPPAKQRGTAPTAAPKIPNFPAATGPTASAPAADGTSGAASDDGPSIAVTLAIAAGALLAATGAFIIARRRRAPR
ncbi:MAG: CehA/McbA family metallohydrolase, partial [Acidimicrobiales bacterium]